MSKPIIGYNEHWEAKTFYNKVSSWTFRILKVGSDYYLFGLYSGNYRNIFKYNSSSNMWQKYDTTGLAINDFSVFNLWTDGTTVYYSDINSSYNIQLALNLDTLEWTQKTWNNVSIKSGLNIWYDDIHNTVMYIGQGIVKEWINRSGDTWADMGLNGWTTSDQEQVTGADFWCDRVTGDWYGSSPFASYKLASGTTTWVKVWTNGLKPDNGINVWSDGTNIYYSGTHTDGQLIYDRAQDTWVTKTWTGPLTNFNGMFIENVPGHTYHCSGTIYELNTTQDTFEESYITLSDSIFIDGRYVWTDGTDTYYSYQASQYVLDKTTSTWIQKTWTGLTNFTSGNIWTDGENTYYSADVDQYVLDKATSTWLPKTWTGITEEFYGEDVWTDGTDIYYSGASDQYVLDKATSTWSPKTWTGLANFYGSQTWTDGENTYYSIGTDQYVLDKATSTWSPKTWSGSVTLDGSRIWTDGIDTYYSYQASQYVLDKTTSTWSPKVWEGLTSFNGEYIWTDSESIYLNSQYTLIKEPIYGKELPKYLNEEGLEHVASKMKQVAIFETRTALDAALANHELTDYTIVMVRNDNL